MKEKDVIKKAKSHKRDYNRACGRSLIEEGFEEYLEELEDEEDEEETEEDF